MSQLQRTAPQFPLTMIYDDGETDVFNGPEDLLERLDSFDSTDPRNRVWVRDEAGHTIRLKMMNGEIVVFEAI